MFYRQPLLVAELYIVCVLFSATFWHIESTPNNSGFISIDCGAGQDYVDPETGIYYKSDRDFISTGENENISPEYDEQIPYYGLQLKNLRFFPKGKKNCYTLRPEQGKNHNYLLRLYFKYGNYDSRNQIPVFFVHLGVNPLGPGVHLRNLTDWIFIETIYFTRTDTIEVCLVNTGSGTPFISALELRFLNDSSYQNLSGPLYSLFRGSLGSTENSRVRYKDDVYDRMWSTIKCPDCISLNTTLDNVVNVTKSNNSTDLQQLPSEVWRSANQPQSPLRSLIMPPFASCPEERCYFCLYFAEILDTAKPKSREFNIVVNNQVSYGPVALEYLKPFSLCQPFKEGSQLSLNATNRSQLPPILNAIEFFVVVPFPNIPTHPTDVEGISSIMGAYDIQRDEWQGDPCIPRDLSWNGLNCSYETNPPRIISLDLSSSKLTGNISSSFFILKGLEYLDLSYNELTGRVPEFLALLPNLTSLNLSGNKLAGLVPQSLLEKSNNGILQLSLAGNPNICESADSCAKTPETRRSLVLPFTTSVIGFLVFLLFIIVIIFWRKQNQDEQSKNESSGSGLSKNRSFSFAEIIRITDNFKTIIGEGGFGKVYLGTLIDHHNSELLVAVKLLSRYSRQGYKEFQAEAQLLMIVHHRNLVSLIGYCDDQNNKALIYEYMANGNLREHLSEETSGSILSWEERPEIAVDAAHGLEYLHNGCKPPILHRDLKTSNILLNEKFQAKISDFGLSRAFPKETDSHITTTPAGTYGYIAPEAQASGNFNRKSDVYGFGIILLELITGNSAFTQSTSGDVIRIQQRVMPILQTGDITKVIDPKLRGQFETNSAWKTAEIALACANDAPAERPDMSIVVAELKECLALAMPVVASSVHNNSLQFASFEIDSDMVPSPR